MGVEQTGWQPRDHPREYGENSVKAIKVTLWQGSSPRIRGKSQDYNAIGDHVGIIPANTGKIFEAGFGCGVSGDHPREYGENRWLRP